jgi:hypothetical protein
MPFTAEIQVNSSEEGRQDANTLKSSFIQSVKKPLLFLFLWLYFNEFLKLT